MWVKGRWIKQEYTKVCLYCGTSFTTAFSNKKYCCNEHLQADRKNRIGDTLEKFFQYMILNYSSRAALTVKDLMELYEQQEGLCALSGVEMTYISGKGRIPTNIGIDRIEAGGPYIRENIRLVCNHVNTMRLDKSDEEFLWWCKRIIENGSIK